MFDDFQSNANNLISSKDLSSFIHFRRKLAPVPQLSFSRYMSVGEPDKDNHITLVAACKLRLKYLTCRTRFLLEPTRKMPTVFSPCSSRYLKSHDFDDADDYNHNKAFVIIMTT